MPSPNLAVRHRVLARQQKDVRADRRLLHEAVAGAKQLNLGDRGPAVEALQRALKGLNLYSGAPSGKFDAETQKAVRALEAQSGRAANGTVDSAELKAIRKRELFVNDGFETSGRVGDKGNDIRGIEKKLGKLGFKTGKVDGVFDRELQKAVKAFRKADPSVPDQYPGIGPKVLAGLHAAIDGLAAPAPEAPAAAPENGPKSKGETDLVISSFNITGSSHTGPGGEHPEFESGKKRVRYAAKLLKKHKVDVVGFQELQGDQLKEFRRVTDNKYGVFPGSKMARRDSENSVAWNKEEWSLVKGDTVKIPYFNGTKRHMPVVLLENKETGQRAYFTNFHNPADTKRFHNQQKYRNAATNIEIDLVNRLQKQSGLPVFLTGDMNERHSYYEKMTNRTSMEAANKLPNRKGLKNVGIDWIFGSKGVDFSHYVRDRSRLVRKTTNHPMIVTQATIKG
jgi:peptidoglycan hydrolase-like protein with peptidoglycan-binding domain